MSTCTALKSRRKKAQDGNDLSEEAKLCNAIGEVYMRKGNYNFNKYLSHTLMYKETICV